MMTVLYVRNLENNIPFSQSQRVNYLNMHHVSCQVLIKPVNQVSNINFQAVNCINQETYLVHLLATALKNKMWKMSSSLCSLVDLEVKSVLRSKHHVRSANVKGACDVDLWNRRSRHNLTALIDCLPNLERS